MVTLTNSSHATVDAQIKNVGLMELFEDRLSIEDIQCSSRTRMPTDGPPRKRVCRQKRVGWWRLTDGISRGRYGRAGARHFFPARAPNSTRWPRLQKSSRRIYGLLLSD